MKRYAEFQEFRNGKYWTPCGSFSYLVLDARRNINNEIYEIIEYAKNEPWIDVKRILIRQGNFKHSRIILTVDI
jgi:hypothetical protein